MTNPTESSDETTKITSSVRRVSVVLRSGRFQVPWHQRKYDWSAGEVDDLLQDLRDALERDKTCYFLGSIMLFKARGSRVWRINDVQQRLITISLLMAALCRRFASSEKQAHEHMAMRALFDVRDDIPVRLGQASLHEPRIDPPAHDRENYRRLLKEDNIPSGGLLASAWEAVDDFVESLDPQNRELLFNYVNQKVEISVLDIPADVDENLVFETLNARGKRLDDVDLIRNHLYSYFPESEEATRRQNLQENLERPRSILRGKTQLPRYYRSFLQCRYGFLQEARLYRKARGRIEREAHRSQPQSYVASLVSELGREENIHLYRKIALMRQSETLDGNLPKVRGRRNLDVLLGELQNYTVSHPLCFALLHRFLSADKPGRRAIGATVTRGLRNLNAFIMRSVLVNPAFRPSKIEEGLADAAGQVFTGEDLASLDIMDALKSCDAFSVVDDAGFVRRVSESEFRPSRASRSNQKALRILFAINAHEDVGSDALDRAGCSVEHVLPESDVHWAGWCGFNAGDAAALVYRLGNMVVLSRKENRGGNRFNSKYDVKREAFRRSPIMMARKVAEEYEEWNPAVIRRRSKHLAKKAAQIWKFRR
ncbi:MAG: DUF262 domain-containing HNH endonuclease family protein [Acidobacteriota bacterium]|nr:DUF262 domain-containing HNH endonuclease family protein [Acidobacteriota bacterium]